MTDRALEQTHHIAPFLFTLLYQGKHGIKGGEKSGNDFRRVGRADIDTVTSQITFCQHLLGDQCFVGQGIGPRKSKARQRRQTPMIDPEAVPVSKLLPALANGKAGLGGPKTICQSLSLNRWTLQFNKLILFFPQETSSHHR